MIRGNWYALNRRLYSMSLRLYPATFVAAYRHRLLDAFADRWDSEHSRGAGLAWLRVWRVVLRDIAVTVPAERRTRPGQRGFGRRSGPVLAGAGMDLRITLRGLLRRPGFALLAIVTLVLGIGANVALFSVVEQLVVNPYPIDAGDRLTYMMRSHQTTGLMMSPAWTQIEAWREGNRSFELLEPVRTQRRTVLTGGQPRYLMSVEVFPRLMHGLGLRPAAGRLLQDTDVSGPEPVAVISRRLWTGMFGSDPAIVGRTIAINDTSFTIVGVLHERVNLGLSDATDLWIPFQNPELMRDRSTLAVGVLREGITPEIAEQDLAAIEVPGLSATWTPSVSLPTQFLGGQDFVLRIMLAAVGMVLLIACANVANMLLARGVGRTHELSVRAALGASRARLARQLMGEALVLGTVGGALGLLVAHGALGLLVRLRPDQLWALEIVELNRTALLFAVSASVLAAVVFGLIPALRFSRTEFGPALRLGLRSGAGAQDSRLRQSLVAVEVALALVIFAGAGLMARSLLRLGAIDPGFVADGLAVLELELPGRRYTDRESRTAFTGSLVERVSALPGVASVALSSGLPTRFGITFGTPVAVGGEPAEPGVTSMLMIGPDYFRTSGTLLREGREFTEAETRQDDLVIINESLAERLWPGESAVGRRITMGEDDSGALTVIGVAQDVRSNSLRPSRTSTLGRDQIYSPGYMDQSFTMLIRMAPGARIPDRAAITAMVHEFDAALPVESFGPAAAVLAEALGAERFRTVLFGLFAALGLTLSAIGVYGVVSLAVSQRVPEIGVRMALGASRGRVLRMILGRGMLPVAAGLVAGLLATGWLTRFIEGLLYEVERTDPLTLAGVCVAMSLIAALACLVPAVRATRIDPVVAMRVD